MSEFKKILTYYKYTDGAYEQNPEEGFFAFSERQGKDGIHRIEIWYDCRESFHIHFNEDEDGNYRRPNQFLFFTEKYSERVARFIEEVEKRLNVKPKTQILGFKNCSNIVSVQFSKWWKQNEARWQLFTILLRCGLNYKGNFTHALYSNDYIKETREAVERFFKGYTHFNGNDMKGNEGWVYHFHKQDFEDNFDYFDTNYEKDLEKAWQKQLARLKKP